MAFKQYNSTALKKRQEEYEKKLAKKISKKEDERQKKYGFLLNSPNVIEDYDPKTSGEGNRGQDKKRIGSIYTEELKADKDNRMSPDLEKALFRPIKVAPISREEIMKKKTRKKHTPRSARYYAEGTRRTAKIYRKKKGAPEARRSKSAAQGGRRKTRRKKRRKKRRNKRGGVVFCSGTDTHSRVEWDDLQNRVNGIFHVKCTETSFFHPECTGHFRLVSHSDSELVFKNINDENFSFGPQFEVPRPSFNSNSIVVCEPNSGATEEKQAEGGRRKRRRKTKKNKRSKKRRVKKRKTRKRRKKRR